ncbi:MAG: hypothetical protein ACE362_08325 [Phaeodactylibacter xiamenensis]|uniref:Uncharacterized protein n=1 Tax=Phaeodactylibacter xiamenensis TaxID=1524460 RepID=A0A098S910_9BACT|nr:hypothetical protein [Phaeodactylibacter xiamenensis]KGE88595.1 hypothetical protein IX84_07930 [Phaeodactylibacter xiamenensis]
MKSKKARKVSFKLFLHKTASREESGFYPVYLRITYNRQNTKVPDVLLNDHYLMWREEDLENFQENNMTPQIREQSKYLNRSLEFYEKIIRHEDPDNNEDYTVIGIGDRARVYRKNVLSDLSFLLEYLERVEFEQLFSARQIPEVYPEWAFPDRILELKERVSEGFKRLHELYALLSLYEMDYYNGYKTDYILGGTYYHWLIDDGMDRFKQFLKAYFGSKQRLDETYLSGVLNREDKTIVERQLANALEHLPPQEKYTPLYLSILANHCEKIANRDLQ